MRFNRQLHTRRLHILVTTGLLALAGCDSDTSPAGPDPDPTPDPELATIAGQVESTQTTAGAVAMASEGVALQAEATTVAAAAVRADGSLEVLAEAEVQADGRFSIEDVPTGRSGLLVSARAQGGEEVGRVLVHGETRTESTLATAPINGETTVEGLVHSRLEAAGAAAEIRNTALLALLIRMEESTASQVAASGLRPQIRPSRRVSLCNAGGG